MLTKYTIVMLPEDGVPVTGHCSTFNTAEGRNPQDALDRWIGGRTGNLDFYIGRTILVTNQEGLSYTTVFRVKRPPRPAYEIETVR